MTPEEQKQIADMQAAIGALQGKYKDLYSAQIKVMARTYAMQEIILEEFSKFEGANPVEIATRLKELQAIWHERILLNIGDCNPSAYDELGGK